ncbi:hypothetical protein ACI2IX_15100 [Leifsonia aquatica]|uniref:hypothetical protein n=1 Tax=Leifsonia aquatica TaxID=144185 RepID=UPI00384EA063
MVPTAQGRRELTHLADTSFLLCFGGVARGVAHLKELFGGGLAVPPAVRSELATLPRNPKKIRAVRLAADQFGGKGAALLLDAPIYEGDADERDLALDCLKSGNLPPRHDGKLKPQGNAVTDVAVGANAGEAEAIAAAFRREVPLLITDGPAIRHATARGLPTETAARSISRLSLSAKEKYRVYLEMERSVGNAGETVNGWMWYREPRPTD